MREEEMDCKEICELLTAYLDGEVTPEEKASIEAHLPGCPQCRAEIEALSATQASLRGLLKSMADEVSPSSQAWEKVRARLETKDGWSRFWSSFTFGRVATAAAAVVILIVAVVIWQFGGIFEVGAPPPAPAPAPVPAPAPEPTPTPVPAPTPVPPPVIEIPPPPRPAPPPLQVSAIPDEGYYLPGQPVEIEFSYTSAASEPITVSPFPSKIQIISPRPYEVVRSFASGTREIVLEPGEVVTHTLTWNQKDAEGKQVAPGWYYVSIEDITITEAAPPRKTGLSIGTITRILIQYPQGALEKTIELNQSQTVNDITITLERAELLKTEAKFYAFAIPPRYSPPERAGPDIPPLPHPPPEMVPVHAEYTVDGVTRDAGYSGIGSENDGIRLIWDNLDPVPSDAQVLTFTITRFGEVEGPWEFKIPLE